MKLQFILLFLCCFVALDAKQEGSKVKYVIVLMMENRSFDHLLGHLGLTDKRIDGINGTEFNHVNPLDPSKSKKIYVDLHDAEDLGPDDPCHSFECITQQIYGFEKKMDDKTSPVTMDGFVANAVGVKHSPTFVMSAFNASNLPVLSSLATEYAVFDHWHCSCPCPTNPNREFLMSGTSHGMTNNTIPKDGFPQETHFAFLERHNISWKIYFNDDPWMAPAFADLRVASRWSKVQEMPNFFKDLTDGTLPEYVLIEPRMATSHAGPSNWQHPDNSVSAGEALIREVYQALRASKYWNESLLVITYDEHGGFFDHQHPAHSGVPAPDKMKSWDGFDFTRLGIRIPTVMVSPWIAKGSVIGEPTGARAPTSTSQYDATSIISSANKIFGITEHMTERDAWSGTFHDLVDGVQSPLREDCPMTLPAPVPLTQDQLRYEMNLGLNDHHLDSLDLLCSLTQHIHPVCADYNPDDTPSSSSIHKLSKAAFIQRLQVQEQRSELAPLPYVHDMAVHTALDAVVAGLLRQRHFGEISKYMVAHYTHMLESKKQ